MNEIILWSASSNTSGGIRITGAETALNIVSRPGTQPQRGRVYDNGGPGIWINSPSNVVRALNVAGNLGDGILIEDSQCRDVLVSEVRSGFDDHTGAPRANQGSGLHIRNGARNIVVGTADAGMTDVNTANHFGRGYFGVERRRGMGA
jgi:hypothetical protein